MRRIRVPHTPALGPLSTFPETNVRTYLLDPEGRPGVWFCSLDITRLVPALVARVSYRLPYCWAKMSIERDRDLITYTSRRRWPRPAAGEAESRTVIRVGQQVRPAEVDELLRQTLPLRANDELAGRLLHQTGGNPLFLQQLAGVVAEEGPSSELPDSLRALIAARLDQLNVSERQVLDNAATLGLSGTLMSLERFANAINQPFDRLTVSQLDAKGFLVVEG
eukprot:gene32783-55316_t